jgi:hypothetical protein
MTRSVYLQCGGRRRDGRPCFARLDRIAHERPAPQLTRLAGHSGAAINLFPSGSVRTDAWQRTDRRNTGTDGAVGMAELRAYFQSQSRHAAIRAHQAPTIATQASDGPGKHVYRCGKCPFEGRVNAARLEEVVLRAIAQGRDVIRFGTDL